MPFMNPADAPVDKNKKKAETRTNWAYTLDGQGALPNFEINVKREDNEPINRADVLQALTVLYNVIYLENDGLGIPDMPDLPAGMNMPTPENPYK